MSDRAFDQIEGMNLENKVLSLIPWTEYVGKIINIADGRITLEAIRQISISITPDMLKKSELLRKGEFVGVLVLDDGSIRIRRESVLH